MKYEHPLRIGLIAPPWLPVPPQGYGGTELILDVLGRGLQARGHRVELFTVGSSTCDVPRRSLFADADPDRMGSVLLELRHVAAAYDAFETCDIVHDHTLSGLFLSGLHPDLTVVTTNHGPFGEGLSDLYRRTARRVPVIAISRDQARSAPADVPVATVIHHGLDLDRYPAGRGDGGYLVSLGRMNPDKGIDTAIEVARRSGLELKIAAKLREPAERRYFAEVIEPMLGGGVEYIGEADHQTKVKLLGGARALVNPIHWPEPFGLVMTEALACGTPVVATPLGSVPEIVEDGRTGFLGADVDELVDGVRQLDSIDRSACRAVVTEHFSMERMAADHEAFYNQVLCDRQRSRSAGRSSAMDELRALQLDLRRGRSAEVIRARPAGGWSGASAV